MKRIASAQQTTLDHKKKIGGASIVCTIRNAFFVLPHSLGLLVVRRKKIFFGDFT
jgi:hypothetical protein